MEDKIETEGPFGSIEAKLWHGGRDVRLTFRKEDDSLYLPVRDEALEVMRGFFAGTYERVTHSSPNGTTVLKQFSTMKDLTIIEVSYALGSCGTDYVILLPEEERTRLVELLDIALAHPVREESGESGLYAPINKVRISGNRASIHVELPEQRKHQKSRLERILDWL